MAITAKDVAALREMTGVGMMDCKRALTEADGDTEKAIAILREKGLAAAAKKAGRIAAEGIVTSVVDMDKRVGVVLEVNAETDFVAKNEKFVKFVDTVAKTIINENPADLEALENCKAFGTDMTVVELLRDHILTIGENMKIRRFIRLEGVLASYVHGGGRIGVMVQFETDADPSNETFARMGKDVAMQVAAANPLYLDRDSVPADVIANEKEILTQQAINEGKPANIAEKMVAGRIQKYYKEFCLVEQEFIKDTDTTVAKYIDSVAKDLGCSIKVTGFVRYERGEGIAKREDNFADEVAKMVK